MGVHPGTSEIAALIAFPSVQAAQAFWATPFAPRSVRAGVVTDVIYSPTLLAYADEWVLKWGYKHTAINSGDWGGNARRYIAQACARAGVAYRLIDVKEVGRTDHITQRRRRYVSHAAPLPKPTSDVIFKITEDWHIETTIRRFA
jgi:hypothetical protein